MHSGNKNTNKASKTEAIFFPSTLTCNTWIKEHENNLLTPDPPPDPNQITKKSTTTPKQKENILSSTYENCTQTKDIPLPDDDHIPFKKSFKYLGSIVNFTLQDNQDIEVRIKKANQAMGALKHFWRSGAVDTHAKYLIYMAIPMNLLLWGCKSWALPK